MTISWKTSCQFLSCSDGVWRTTSHQMNLITVSSYSFFSGWQCK